MEYQTQYKLYRHGQVMELDIAYEHIEPPAGKGYEELQVLSVSPAIEFADFEREEIELHCWSDRAMAMSLEDLAENESAIATNREVFPCLRSASLC
ncbi:hypothetical protein [Neptuniibacter sp.]|uniref:hypothetical protein n=1 Tax=Neptuniibacter sp. TaxID=1962643 RepID=UPI0026078FC1|nr:hypothetical protein [Neptuniibacter sp.]MCP4597825.1 hypothetical protein [Neptuniibacter sp.]